jgi:O-antigen/teichoic acid export membrane protein
LTDHVNPRTPLHSPPCRTPEQQQAGLAAITTLAVSAGPIGDMSVDPPEYERAAGQPLPYRSSDPVEDHPTPPAVPRAASSHRHHRPGGSLTAPNGSVAGNAQPGRLSPGRGRNHRPEQSWSALADANKRYWQEAGIAALIGIATQVSLTRSEAPTAIIPAIPAGLGHPVGVDSPARDPRGLTKPQTDAGGRWEPWRILQTRLRADHMVRNSLYLILSSGLQAVLGFGFWIIVARLFNTADVGRASSLISATTLLALLALLGLNNSFVRYLPTAPNRDALITAGLLLVAVCGATIGLFYLLLTPVLAPRLAFVLHRPVLAAGFVLLTAAAAVNLLTDSVFIASRKAGYNALIDGGVGGLTKLVFVVILVGTGAYGLFCAYASGFVAAALASVVLISTALRWRPSVRKSFRTLKPLLRFSGANYAGNVLNTLPTLVVPLIVLDRLGAPAAAYYFVAFQVASLLYSAAYAVGEASLAEGSQAEVNWRELVRRSRRVMMVLCLPPCLVLVVAAHWILLAFGAKYSQYGAPSLILLAVAAVPIAANNWLLTVLRLQGRLRAIVLSSGVYAIAICGLAWLLAPHGLDVLAAAWPIGGLLGAAVAAVPRSPLASRRQTIAAPPRHRRAARTTPGLMQSRRLDENRSLR